MRYVACEWFVWAFCSTAYLEDFLWYWFDYIEDSCEFFWNSVWFFSFLVLEFCRLFVSFLYSGHLLLWYVHNFIRLKLLDPNWVSDDKYFKRYRKYIYPIVNFISIVFTEWRSWFKLSKAAQPLELGVLQSSGVESEIIWICWAKS